LAGRVAAVDAHRVDERRPNRVEKSGGSKGAAEKNWEMEFLADGPFAGQHKCCLARKSSMPDMELRLQGLWVTSLVSAAFSELGNRLKSSLWE